MTNLLARFACSLGLVLLVTGCYGTPWDYGPDRSEMDLAGDDGFGPIDHGDDGDDGAGDDGDLGGADAVTLRGFVRDPHGLRVVDVGVYVDDQLVTTTDAEGRFDLPDADPGERVVMAFYKPGWATGWGEFVPTAGGHNFFSHTLSPVDLDTEFDANAGTGFVVDGTHTFEFAPGSIRDADGNPYDGVVSLQATVWDRTPDLDDGSEYLASPGDGRGTDTNGDSQLLYTIGMFQLTMTGDQGQPLESGPGIRVQVDVPADSNLEPDEQVPFWTYDEQENTWEEVDLGRVIELPGGGQAWEFQPTTGLPLRQSTTEQVTLPPSVTCNPDVAIVEQDVSATATGKVTDPSGQPVPGAGVRLIADDQTYMVPTQTDSEGRFSVAVPPWVPNPVGPNGRDLILEVDYETATQPYLWRQDPVAAPAANAVADFGEIRTGSMTCVQGTVRDPSGSPVGGVAIAGSHGGNTFSGSDGSFCMQVPKWQPSSVYALPDLDDTVGFEPARIRPADVVGGGSCEDACPNTIELVAYPSTTCATGTITTFGEPADGLRIDAFDARYPTAPIFSTVAWEGQYDVNLPADAEVVLRVGAGDLHGANECASQPLSTPDADDPCATVATMACGG